MFDLRRDGESTQLKRNGSLPEVSGVKAQDRKILLRDATIPSDVRFLLCLIDTWADANGENAFPSTDRLMKCSGWSKDKFWKVFKLAKKTGHLTYKKVKGERGFPKNKYTLKIRGQNTPEFRGTTKSLYQNSDSLAVESEAILRVLPDHLKEDSPKYG